jgi:Na+-driven multidrug efflux pump
MILGAAAVFVFEVFPEYLISMFGSGNALYMEFAVFFMRTFLVLTPFAGVYLITMNFFTAIGKPLKGMLISLTRQVGLYVPMIFLLPFLFGVKGVAFVGPVSDTGVAIVSFILVTRELSKSKAAVYDHS